ncbi:glycosyl hydrolase family 61-domain-containing protein [Xylariales sp. PMI_506]|nr:glycosyl hydrolase family 61-domain-containing protein [Xylariales sp. PMI_506]
MKPSVSFVSLLAGSAYGACTRAKSSSTLPAASISASSSSQVTVSTVSTSLTTTVAEARGTTISTADSASTSNSAAFIKADRVEFNIDGISTGVLAHGHINNIVVNGVYYEGYDPTSFPYETNPPVVVGWTAADLDNGFVAPDAYQSPDIICHKNATPAGGHASVNAGDYVLFQWVPIPWPHPGPILDYLAKCEGNCEDVDKTTLEFFKIDGIGLINGSNPGFWASDVLIANNNTWVVQIPEELASGNYVLRHEIIALHSAESLDGAQNYPQCFNLAVKGTGSLQPSGTLGTALYQETDPGILFDIYTSPLCYGPRRRNRDHSHDYEPIE